MKYESYDPNLSAQQIFDIVSKHLLEQNKISINYITSLCAYRSAELKCAVGCLIPDEKYDANIEGISMITIRGALESPDRYVDDRSPLLVNILKQSVGEQSLEKNIVLLIKLQNIHDLVSPLLWETKLKSLKDEFKLS